MSNEPKSSDKPIPVDGKVTPITQTPIEEVDSSLWNSYNLSDLLKHKSTLERRYYYLLDMNKYDIAQQVKRGMDTLDVLIKQKNQKTPGFST